MHGNPFAVHRLLGVDFEILRERELRRKFANDDVVNLGFSPCVFAVSRQSLVRLKTHTLSERTTSSGKLFMSSGFSIIQSH